MTRTPRSSRKRIAPAEAAKKVSKAKKPGKQQVKTQSPKGSKVRRSAAMMKPRIPMEIRVARREIDYDPKLAGTKGYLTIANGMPALRPNNGDTLLHLLFFLIYTQEGAELLRDNGPTTADTPDQAKDNLKAELLRRFPTIDDQRPVLDPVIDAHFAADRYVAAVQDNNAREQDEYRELYSQKLLAILGELHDDAMAHEFSMLW